MYRNIVFRIIAGLVLLAAIAGIAFFAYQAGVTHSVAAPIQLPVTQRGQPVQSYFWHPFFGVDIFSLLFDLFLLLLAFSAMRRLIFGPRWGRRHMGHGTMGHGLWSEDVPPMFTEWHRRAHASHDGDKVSGEDQK